MHITEFSTSCSISIIELKQDMGPTAENISKNFDDDIVEYIEIPTRYYTMRKVSTGLEHRKNNIIASYYVNIPIT